MRKYLSNVHKIGDAHLQCGDNHYAKFENKEMKTVGVTDYTNQTPPKHFWTEKGSAHLQYVDSNYEKFA